MACTKAKYRRMSDKWRSGLKVPFGVGVCCSVRRKSPTCTFYQDNAPPSGIVLTLQSQYTIHVHSIVPFWACPTLPFHSFHTFSRTVASVCSQSANWSFHLLTILCSPSLCVLCLFAGLRMLLHGEIRLRRTGDTVDTVVTTRVAVVLSAWVPSFSWFVCRSFNCHELF